ncbi:MAG TPA: ester cyclase [Candidatus Limnocylindrales bacterium]|nr:ester cyclase [Candidatus Limnocylindrales bacterium]
MAVARSPAALSPTEVVRRLYTEVINHDRLDELDELIAADYVNYGPFPWGVHDRDDLRRFYLVREMGFPDIKVSIDDIMAAGDVVAYRMTVSGTDTGEFLNVAPTQRPVSVTGFGWVRVRDGKIAEHWGLIDELGILDQIGVKPESIGRHAARRSAPTAV